jgi:hypothetical protein
MFVPPEVKDGLIKGFVRIGASTEMIDRNGYVGLWKRKHSQPLTPKHEQ